MLQSAWRRSPSRRRLLLEQHLGQTQRESATTTVVPAEGNDSTSIAASSMTPTAGAGKKTSTGLQHLMSHEHLLQGAETLGAVYAVWGAFTSLLTTKATRHAVRRAVGQALLAPAAATLAAFNGDWRKVVTTTAFPSSTSPSSSSSPRIRIGDPPDPEFFDCALRFKRDMAVAVRRVVGTVRACESSLSTVRAAAGWLIYGDNSYGDRGGGGNGGSDMEAEERREGGVEGMKAAEAEAVSLVSEVAEVCVCVYTTAMSETRTSCRRHFYQV